MQIGFVQKAISLLKVFYEPTFKRFGKEVSEYFAGS
jgi:hypothetical protein